MKKFIFLLVLLFFSTSVFSQLEKELKLNEETNLIEATYYHDNGQISQKGTFNLDRKLHGDWVNFNENGTKISAGTYTNGVRTGKWTFWNDGIIKEVEFNNNVIASVTDREGKSSVVTKD